MPLLVGKLDMTGKILTADAMSTQKDIIDCIRKKGGGLPDRTQGPPAGAVLRGVGRTQKENAAAFLHGRSFVQVHGKSVLTAAKIAILFE